MPVWNILRATELHAPRHDLLFKLVLHLNVKKKNNYIQSFDTFSQICRDILITILFPWSRGVSFHWISSCNSSWEGEHHYDFIAITSVTIIKVAFYVRRLNHFIEKYLPPCSLRKQPSFFAPGDGCFRRLTTVKLTKFWIKRNNYFS